MKEATSGLLLEFADANDFLTTVRAVKAAGCSSFETFAPYPVEGLEEELMAKRSSIPGVMLGAAVVGATFGFMLQWYAARDYRLDVGGRPVFSWPAFIPVTFELGVLTAVLVGIATFLWRAGLPRYHHPVFSAERFARASTDRFFVWLPEGAGAVPSDKRDALLRLAHAETITEVLT